MVKERSGKIKIGFFGGSFDPIHFGHLKMAKDLANSQDLQEVWFCPARINPHKLDHSPVSITHRMNMIARAIEGETGFSLLNIEAKREGPSYTIDTIRELVRRENSRPSPREIYLILSDEALPGLFHWKDPEEIIHLVPLLIGSRVSSSEIPPRFEGSRVIRDAIEKGWSPTEPINISSTEIRQRLKRGQDCKEFLPKKVLDYISLNNLYC